MSLTNTKIDVKPCAKIDRIHPCDPQLPCDPFFKANDCPTPYICQDRLKNPAYPGEITTCRSGSYMFVKSCKKEEPPHKCDPAKPCSEMSDLQKNKKPACKETPLCMERLKNAERTMKDPPCDETK